MQTTAALVRRSSLFGSIVVWAVVACKGGLSGSICGVVGTHRASCLVFERVLSDSTMLYEYVADVDHISCSVSRGREAIVYHLPGCQRAVRARSRKGEAECDIAKM